MALRVPQDQIVHLKNFLELPDEKIKEFLNALIKARPEFNVDDLNEQLSKGLDLPKDLVKGLIGVLASLYRVNDRRNIPIETFVDREVYPALKQTDIFSETVAAIQWPRLRNFFLAALSLEKTVGTTAKVGYVMTQHERIFTGARIFTDVRSIFHHNVAEKPESAVIIHMLRISQRDNYQKQTDEYFALDSNDIRTLKAVIDRALRKEEALKGLMENSGVIIIPPKAHF